jgi:cellulose synthase/poly-beta-1,6-N-acetylglucosamine synthase-like glycosyltransferase
MAISIIIISTLILGAYIFLMALFFAGWQRNPRIKPEKHTSAASFSIVIPVRNEQDNIISLLHSLKIQTYNHKLFELIIVDDHSVDSTIQIIKKFSNRNDDLTIRIVSLEEGEYSKKQALKKGIEQARAEVVVMTDADCVARPDYLNILNEYYHRQKPMLMLGPVKISSNKSMFSRWQALEFSSLIFTAAGSAGVGMPVMANGANLIFDRTVFKEHEGEDVFLQRFASGDDMFLLDYVKKQYGSGSICFVANPSAVMETKAAESASQFFAQRKRWVSKSKAYTNPMIISTALIVLLLACVQIFLVALAVFKPVYIPLMVAVWTGKMLTDFWVLGKISAFLNQQNLMLWFFPIALFYPFYIVVSAFAGLFTSYEWKGRKHR